jgi:3-oxoadipate enol-lactonase
VSASGIHHVEEGPTDAPVLVLSNSLGSALAMWDPQVPAFAERLRVVRYDLRGHGASEVPTGPYAIDDLGADLLALLDDLGVARAHLCGLSLGGLVSAWVAAHDPARVDRLVLCCTTACFGPPQAWRDRAATVRAEGTGAVADAVAARWFTPGWADRHPGELRTMRDMIAATPPSGYAWCCEVVADTDLRPQLPAIAAPTLVIAAAEDPAVSVAQARELASGIAGARLETIEDAAHLANVERPDEVTRLVLEHLTEEER